MSQRTKNREELLANGFSVLNEVYSEEEIQTILEVINRADSSKETFRKTTELFAIRQFLREVPETFDLIFTEKLKMLIREMMGDHFFVVKSIYFDKPESSNWYVSYHQDLTISVDKKIELPDFGPWTTKQNQFAVQPPIGFLENITTIRIHLDDTDENNGALKVIPKSHLKNIYRSGTMKQNKETEITCSVKRGGVMFMKPLTLHSSGRTINSRRRRVIHIEFSNLELPTELKWSERIEFSGY